MLKSGAVILAAILAMASAQLPSPYFSLGGGGGGPPPGSPGASPYSGLGPSPSSPYSSRPSLGGGGPFGGGRPGFPGGKPPRQSGPSKLFSWLGSTMSKLPGLVPKVQFHSSKPQKPSFGGPSSLSGLGLGLAGPGQKPPQTYFSSPHGGGGPSQHSLILPQIPNSVFETSPSPFGGAGGSSVSFAPSNSIDHPPVRYRSPGPSPFGPRPGGPPSASPFGPRPGGPPPPSFGGRPSSISFSNVSPFGGRSPYSASPYASSESPYSISSAAPRPLALPPQHIRNNLEVFPSQQVGYQSQTLTQNQPGYNDALSGLQNLYGSQQQQHPSQGKPAYAPLSAFEQQSSYTQPQQIQTSANNYGATFHSIEPVRVAPIYDIAQHFKSSSADLSGSQSAPQKQQHQQQSQGNIHDTPFTSLVSDYASQADAATSGSEQMLSALQSAGADLMSSATSNQPIQGIQIMGSPDGNPMFEVVADANAPTFDGHPVDLNKLISMIEPGAQIDTIPSYGDAQIGGAGGAETAASEPQGVFMHPPSSLELEGDAAMASGILNGNKKPNHNNANNNKKPPVAYKPSKTYHLKDRLEAAYSESRPTVVKLDGTRLNDDSLIREHFDKDLILDVNDDDLQGSNNDNEDKGYIVVGLKKEAIDDDNQTGDDDQTNNNNENNEHLQQQNDNNSDYDDDEQINNDNNDDLNNDTNDNNNTKMDKDLLEIIKQLRNSAATATAAVVNSFSPPPSSDLVEVIEIEKVTNDLNNNQNNVTDSSSELLTEPTATQHQHPNHNYNPSPIKQTSNEEETEETSSKNILPRDKISRPPVINPIVDSVRPGRTMSIRTSVKSSTSVEETGSGGVGAGSFRDQQPSASSTNYHRQLHLVDKDIDDDSMLPDLDLIESGDGDDLAMSASRNVKSVAIIVTPPPHYVKIKNKYKKIVTPRSMLTSTTTTTTASPFDNDDDEGGEEGEKEFKIVRDDNSNSNDDGGEEDDGSFSESFNSEVNRSITTTPRSSSLGINRNTNGNKNRSRSNSSIDNNNNSNYGNVSREYEDAMLKLIRGFGNGDAGDGGTTTPASTEAKVPRPRLYPVYRRKATS